jgi:predicted DNA-binding transcriptional regulator AlpA
MAEDRLLTLKEIADKLRMPESTARYKRHLGELPFTFRLGRRVVGYESEADAYIASERAAQHVGAGPGAA